jgi:UDPglucose--hexose-1-phosphate uridylyltransferase
MTAARGRAPVRKTRISLADGRDLIYFDEDGRPDRTARDMRDLPMVEHGSQLRYDELTETWVTIASHRQDRIYLPTGDTCPFCPSTAANLSEIPEADYDVVVFENRFPAFSGSGHRAPEAGIGVDESLPAVGRCEVICFTADHDSSFRELSPERVRLVLEAWVDRTAALSVRADVAQVYCFENRGPEIGATETHPHGQIYAFPFVTPRTSRVLASVRRHFSSTGRNLFDDVVSNESRGSRVVLSGEHWTAVVPHAAKWPFEVHLYPRSRVPNLMALDESARSEFCLLYLELLRRFDALFGIPMPYISGWHQAPSGAEDEFALHLELFSIRRAADKLKFLAGTESGMDAFISDISPESAAERLRSA